MGWMEVGGGGWNWVEVGARFRNIHQKYFKSDSNVIDVFTYEKHHIDRITETNFALNTETI